MRDFGSRVSDAGIGSRIDGLVFRTEAGMLQYTSKSIIDIVVVMCQGEFDLSALAHFHSACSTTRMPYRLPPCKQALSNFLKRGYRGFFDKDAATRIL